MAIRTRRNSARPAADFRARLSAAQIVPASAMHTPAKNTVFGPAQPIKQRHDSQTSQRSSGQIGGIERRNMPGLARKHDGEFQSGDKEGNGRRQVDRGESEEIRFRNVQRDWDAQHDHQHNWNDQRIDRA